MIECLGSLDIWLGFFVGFIESNFKNQEILIVAIPNFVKNSKSYQAISQFCIL